MDYKYTIRVNDAVTYTNNLDIRYPFIWSDEDKILYRVTDEKEGLLPDAYLDGIHGKYEMIRMACFPQTSANEAYRILKDTVGDSFDEKQGQEL